MKTPQYRQSFGRASRVISLMVIILLGAWACEFILPNKPPFVKIDSPADDAVFYIGEPVVVNVTAYDDDGTVKEVSFAIDGTLKATVTTIPYTFSWATANLDEGIYKLTVTATDNRNEIYVVSKDLSLLNNLTANAGDDITITSDVTTCSLRAEAPTQGEGTWQVISGVGGSFSDLHDPQAVFTGQACQSYNLRWTVATNASSAFDEINVTFFHTPSQADAGQDFIIDNGSTSVTLAAVAPTAGTGQWSVVSGAGGSFSDVHDPAAVFTGVTCVLYQLQWKVYTNCSSTEDIAEVRFNQAPVPANAGSDQSYTDGRVQVTLAGNLPEGSSGEWTIIEGTGGSFGDASSPGTTFTGQLCQTYTLRWSLTTACGTSTDDVVVTFGHTPTKANAGSDMVLTSGVLSTFLAANNPTQGEGEWSIVSGQGASLDDPTDPGCRFTGSPCQTYVVRWTITTACSSSTDDVTVTLNDVPSASYAGPDQRIIDGSTSIQMQANVAQNGTGTWSIVSGTGGSFDNVNSPSAIFSGQLCQTYVLKWTITTPCDYSDDQCVITFVDIAVPADAGPDQKFNDGTTTASLAGNAPVAGSMGYWTIEAGSGGLLSDENAPDALFTGVLGQIYKLRWTVNSTCSTNYDEMYLAFLQSGTFIDSRNTQEYRTITIGSQTWMAENLNYPITGSWALENQPSYPPVYGRLYTYEAAQEACPAGWHLPSDNEWLILEKSLGMPDATAALEWYRGTVEGGMLKEAGLTHWQNPNAGATGLTFFEARPGGYRTTSGVYGGLGTHAGFWTSTVSADKAMYRALHKDKSQIGRDWSETGYGFSVRCLKD